MSADDAAAFAAWKASQATPAPVATPAEDPAYTAWKASQPVPEAPAEKPTMTEELKGDVKDAFAYILRLARVPEENKLIELTKTLHNWVDAL